MYRFVYTFNRYIRMPVLRFFNLLLHFFSVTSFIIQLSTAIASYAIIMLAVNCLIFLSNWLLLCCHREGNGNPLQYSCLENPMDGGAGRLQSMG